MLANRIAEIQQALDAADLDGWFFSCFQRNDPVSLELLGLPENQLVTRRCYYLLPRRGEPRKLVHALEPALLDHLPGVETRYLTWRDHLQALGELIAGCPRLAAQYSPNNELPAISRLDAGTAEFLRDRGSELISSAELVQQFAAVWTEDQLAGHQRACLGLHQIVHAAFEEVGKALRAGREIDEYAVQRFILESFERERLWTDSDPIVGVNAHSADPHYQPGPDRSSPIHRDDFLLIDLWAKEKRPASIYADITWCGVCAPAPSARQQEIFSTVKAARETGLGFIQQRYPNETVRGFEVDDATRQVIEVAGYGESFIHRTGHSLGIQDHGHGANLDNLETHDTRPLFPMTGFSIEPGIYLPGEFGVRSEINVVLTPDRAEVTGAEPQTELLRLLP
ncbi:MAG: Xaa-Pro peptidase family protein [Thermoanaerobaculia bacterium]